MIREAFLWIYFVVLIVVGVESVTYAFTIEPLSVAIIDLFVNLILVLSVWFFLRGKILRYWAFLLIPAILLPLVFLFETASLEPIDCLFFAIMVIPPAIMGIHVSTADSQST